MGKEKPEAGRAPAVSRGKRFSFLGLTLVAGAVYDAAFGLPILFFPAPLARFLGIVLPRTEVYLRLNGIFLLILALFYLVTALDPDRHPGNVIVAILGRAMGGIFFCGYALWFDGGPVFLLLGSADLGFALIHTWARGRKRSSGAS